MTADPVSGLETPSEVAPGPESAPSGAAAAAADGTPAPVPDPNRRRDLAIGAGLLGLFVVTAVVMAFPQIRLWRTATVGDMGDSFLIQWLLRWDWHGLFSGKDSILHPNIFWPNRNVLLYSDTELAVAPVSAAIASVTGWVVAYNLVYLSGWVISLASSYVLARHLGASRAGAVLGGFVFSFSAVRLGHHTHFQLQFAYFVPLTLWLLLRFFEEKRWWQAVGIGLCCGAVFLNAAYIAAVLYPTVAIVTLGWLAAERFRVPWKLAAGLAAAAVITAVLCYPIVREYRAMGSFLARPYAPEATVTPKNFISPAPSSWLYGWLEDRTRSPFENRLFPGFVGAALAAAGGFALWKGRSRARRPAAPTGTPRRAPDLRRRGLLLVLAASTVPLVLSLGKWQVVAGHAIPLPYRFVAGLPGFQSIRAYGRFFVVPLLALALLAATGYDRLVADRSARTKVVTAVVLGLVILAEYRVKIVMSPRVDLAAYDTVNEALARLPGGPVVELPMADNNQVTWAYVEAPRMLLSAIDWHPRVNGYSGYSPPDYERSVRLFNSLDDGPPASPEALALLDQFGIRYLVIRTAPLNRDPAMKDISYVDEAGASRIVGSLPPERVEAVTKEAGAFLVVLRTPAGATSRP